MKKCLLILLVFCLVGPLAAQSIRFQDKKYLDSLLCGKTWVKYYINHDFTVSDSIIDSIRFYANGTFFESAERRTIDTNYFLDPALSGKWNFGETGKLSRSDTATDYILIVGQTGSGERIGMWYFALIDGHRIKGTGYGKVTGNTDKPFIARSYPQSGIYCAMREIWRPRKKTR